MQRDAIARSFLSDATASDACKRLRAREGEVGGRAPMHDGVARDELGLGAHLDIGHGVSSVRSCEATTAAEGGSSPGVWGIVVFLSPGLLPRLDLTSYQPHLPALHHQRHLVAQANDGAHLRRRLHDAGFHQHPSSSRPSPTAAKPSVGASRGTVLIFSAEIEGPSTYETFHDPLENDAGRRRAPAPRRPRSCRGCSTGAAAGRARRGRRAPRRGARPRG